MGLGDKPAQSRTNKADCLLEIRVREAVSVQNE